MELLSYLTNCLRNEKLTRWSDIMPLTVYIAPFRWYKSKDDSYLYRQLVFNALNIWQQASGNRVSFKIVNNLNASQINLDWKRVDRTSLGHCYYNFDKYGRLYSAEISIGLSDGIIHAQYQDKNEVFHTILHEIGHALGLNHSPYQNDIMYVPHQYGAVKISERDKMTLKWLYTFPYGVPAGEILSKYSLSSGDDLDRLVYKLENKEPDVIKSSFDKALESTSIDEKNLHEEQQLLAEINKYNLSLQNINVSPDLQNYFKKSQIQKEFKKKDI